MKKIAADPSSSSINAKEKGMSPKKEGDKDSNNGKCDVGINLEEISETAQMAEESGIDGGGTEMSEGG